MGTSPERRGRLKRLEIGLAMIGAATLKKKGTPIIIWAKKHKQFTLDR
jgi:hypothetical protein